ncbi:UDP-4-keto-6-deoxy-glucose-3-5-epimerase/ UDP-4-keto-rhamnose-4-keto-reductase [Apiospora sp. TS-2023a]
MHRPIRNTNCAGTPSTPNVTWCEERMIEMVGSNVLGTLNVVDVFPVRHPRDTDRATPTQISNVEFMELAKQYLQPDLTWASFGLDNMFSALCAPQVNCIMDKTNLETKMHSYCYVIKLRREALEVFQIMMDRGL